ncbi:MAG: hypothetical protein V4819_07115 [Verrucomicrobiota bacterium]
MAGESLNLQRNPSWLRTLVRVTLICLGCIVILLPAWLPNRPTVPIKSGTVEFLQACLLAVSAAVILGASSHAGHNRPVCLVIALLLVAAVVGETEDFVSGFLGMKFPEAWLVGLILLAALIAALRHRRVVVRFIATMGNHAGTGLIGSALLILYVFNKLFGSLRFWKASLGADFSPEVPKICKSYLELFGCYLIFVGIVGLSITLARRREP